jgi:protease-4
MSGERAFESSTPKKGTGRSTALLLGATVLAGTVFVVALAVVGAWYWGSGGDVKEQSFLAIKLDGQIGDAPASGGMLLDPADAPPQLTEVARAIRRAADDPRILGIWMKVESPALGWAGSQEVRDALVDFREAGKPCVAWAETWSTGGYFVASACDTVAVAPAGILMVNGLAVHVTYYAGLFEKIGVKADMLHVGDFKSAVEPYERMGPTEPASLAMDQLLDSLYDDFLAPVAAGRGLSVDALRERIDHPALSPQRALDAGLVDVLAYPDQLLADLASAGTDRAAWLAAVPGQQVLDEDLLKEKLTPLSEYLQDLGDDGDAKARIAVVFAEGPIVSGSSSGGLFGGSALGDGDFSEWMDAVREDDTVKAVVLRVNSPGGSALASDMMWRDLQRVKASGKPVVVSMSNYAASGGYYIAAPADWIVAQPNTLTGSIGVFGGKITFAGTYEKLGLTDHVWERGAEADLFSTTESFTDGGRVAYQGFIDDFYQTFLQRVAEGRGMEVSAVHEVAQGRVWSGRQALERGLVDELGGLPEAIAKAAELGGVAGTPRLVEYPKQKTFFELVQEDLEGGNTRIELGVPGLDRDALSEVLALRRVFDGGAVMLLPGNLTVE